jgi:hypothetical protein
MNLIHQALLISAAFHIVGSIYCFSILDLMEPVAAVVVPTYVDEQNYIFPKTF